MSSEDRLTTIECPRCNGTGEVVTGYYEPEAGTCWTCDGKRTLTGRAALVPDEHRHDAARQPASPDLRARIETNLRHAERRPDDDFYRGKASAFRVVLSMLDGPGEPTFACGKPDRGTP